MGNRQKKIDANQTKIVETLRKKRYSVAHTHMVGDGFPDIIVGVAGHNFLFEIKNPEQPPSKRRLTKDEERFHKEWKGDVFVIETAAQAITVVEAFLRENPVR